jgi:hypothetical protein
MSAPTRADLDAMSGAEFVRHCLAEQAHFDGWVSFADRPKASQAAARMYFRGEVDERVQANTVLPCARGWAYRMKPKAVQP